MIDIEKLKALAEAATQGDWSHWMHGVIKGGPVVEFSNGSSQQQIAMTTGAEWMREGEQAANADFIAAANPDAVLELVAEIERLVQRDKMLSEVGCEYCAGEGHVHRIDGEYLGTCDNCNAYELRCVKHERDQLKAENEALRSQVDRLLDHCPDGECATCGEIICPHGGSMHFHHDGCPSCAQYEGESHD